MTPDTQRSRKPGAESDAPSAATLGPAGAVAAVALAVLGSQLGARGLSDLAAGPPSTPLALALRAGAGAVAVTLVALGLRHHLRRRAPGATRSLRALPPRAGLALPVVIAAGGATVPLSSALFRMLGGESPEPGGTPIFLSELVPLLLTVTIATPIAEELLFRGTIQPALAPRHAVRSARVAWMSIISTALLFGAFHGAPLPALNATLLGLVLGWLAHRGASVWPAVAFHGAHNAGALIAATPGASSPHAPDAGYALDVAAATLALALLLWTFARITRPLEEPNVT